MGLFDKVKGILFDEEEVEIPEIKKNNGNINIIKEETSPIKEIKIPKDDFSDKENYKSESTFTFPIDFEDEELKVEQEKPKPKVVERKEIKKQEPRDFSDYLSRKDDHKKFKPTPIISPVYGVLDQNYKKEDVIVKKDVLRKPDELTIDEVRRRAFGTLEEEIVDTLDKKNETKASKLKEKLDNVKNEKEIDKKKTIGELIEEEDIEVDIPDTVSIKDELDEYTSNDEVDEPPKNSIEDLLNEEKNNKDSNDIDDEEADLFSLIDSMYEEKGE